MGEGSQFSTCVDTIEKAYEFMLAYAAQGRDKEGVGGDGPSIRGYLTDLSAALANLDAAVRDEAAKASMQDTPPLNAYADVIQQDAERAKAAVDLVLSTPVITSLLIDNLNATIHIRALLTSVFVIDEAMQIGQRHS